MTKRCPECDQESPETHSCPDFERYKCINKQCNLAAFDIHRSTRNLRYMSYKVVEE